MRPFYLPYREWRRLRRRGYAAQQRGALEVCGLAGADRRRRVFLVFVNNGSRVAAHFEIGWEEVRVAKERIRTAGGRLLGMFHSHPASEAVMGPGDIRGHCTGDFHLIYDVCGTHARLWRVVRGKRGKKVHEVPLVNERGDTARGGWR